MTRLGLLSGLRNSIAFLTILPVGMDEDGLAQAARHMPLYPSIGAVIGLATGILAWVLFPFLPPMMVGMLSLGFILLITGVHHTDGLFDFGDAIMYHGSRREKVRVMHDPMTGAGGVTLALVVLITTALGIGALSRTIVIQSLVASEAAAKFAMVLQAWAGKSAHRGMNTMFIDAMHKRRGRRLRIIITTGLLLAISLFTLQIVGLFLVAAAVFTAGILLGISSKEFGGITGDVLGATNDITRLAALLVVLVAARWV